MAGNSFTVLSDAYSADARASSGAYATAGGHYVGTGSAGPVHPYASLRVGSSQHADGPLLLQDQHLLDATSHFDRERIPERVVHAKGGGAHGHFTCTRAIPDLCAAGLFAQNGKRTDVSVRFSTVGGERGSLDAARDPRGFSIKFRTDEGTLDLVMNSTPIFFLRDPAKFPSFIHTQKRHPASNLTHADDATNYWEYLASNPEAAHQFIWLWGPRGIPRSWQQMQGYSGHTFKFVNKAGAWKYVQLHMLSDQGVSCMRSGEASSQPPDVHQKSLYDAIAAGKFPRWTLHYQLADADELRREGIDPFDLTQVWPRAAFPLHELGKLELNRNVENYFAEIESIAFNPSNLVPGIEPSADPVLQARLFSYPDTHRHRLGPNFQQLPINAPACPFAGGVHNFQRDGPGALLNQGARPNHLSALAPPHLHAPAYAAFARTANYDGGAPVAYLSGVRAEDFAQARALYTRVFSHADRDALVEDVSAHMQSVNPKDVVLPRVLSVLHQVDAGLARQIAERVGVSSYETYLAKMRFIGSHNLAAGLSAQQMFAELFPDRYHGTPPGIDGHPTPAAHSNGHAKAPASAASDAHRQNTAGGNAVDDGLFGKIKSVIE